MATTGSETSSGGGAGVFVGVGVGAGVEAGFEVVSKVAVGFDDRVGCCTAAGADAVDEGDAVGLGDEVLFGVDVVTDACVDVGVGVGASDTEQPAKITIDSASSPAKNFFIDNASLKIFMTDCHIQMITNNCLLCNIF